MKIKLFTLIITIAILTGIIYKEQQMLPLGIVNNASTDINTNFNTSININNKLPDFNYIVFKNNDYSNLYKIYNNYPNSEKIIIHFWASWCDVCKTEFKDIINYAKLHPNTPILAISIDEEKEILQKYLLKFNKNYKINETNPINNLIFIWDHDKSISLTLFNTTMIPETFIINRSFNVIDKKTGKADWVKF